MRKKIQLTRQMERLRSLSLTMDLSDWTFLFEFGCGLFIYGIGAQRIGIDRDGELLISFPSSMNILPSRAGRDYKKIKIKTSVGMDAKFAKEVLECPKKK